MKKFLRVLLYPILFIYLVVILAPKTEGFYLLEEFLQKQKIVVSNEKLVDVGLLFQGKRAEIYYDSIRSGEIQEISIIFGIFYNSVTLDNFSIDEDFKDFFPGDIKSAQAVHSVIKPHIVDISAQGDFGNLVGEVNLLKREVTITLKASAIMSRKYRQLLRGFKQTKEGYVYATQF